MTRTKSTFLALLAVLLSPMVVNADVITFEGQALPGQQLAVGNNYTEGDYNFFNPGNPSDAAIIGQPSQNTSGTDYYTWNSPDANNPVTLTNILGGPFGLLSLDVGAKNSSSSMATFDIVGYLSGGGTLTYNVIDAGAFSNVLLGWTGLSHVEFHYISGNFGAIDNLSVVPEPGTLALLGIGLLGMGAARRRKKA